MIKQIQAYFFEFFKFVKNPNTVHYEDFTNKKKVIHTLKYFLPIAFSFGIIFIALSQFLPEIKMSKEMIELMKNKFVLIGAGVVFAPLLEEFIFRYAIGKARYKNFYVPLVYILTVLFALVHFSNYDTSQINLAWAPLITLPQLCIGFLLAHVRMKFGVWYGVLLHAAYNFCMIIPGVLLGDI